MPAVLICEFLADVLQASSEECGADAEGLKLLLAEAEAIRPVLHRVGLHMLEQKRSPLNQESELQEATPKISMIQTLQQIRERIFSLWDKQDSSCLEQGFKHIVPYVAARMVEELWKTDWKHPHF